MTTNLSEANANGNAAPELDKAGLVALITRETRPPHGMSQWIIIFEAIRLTRDLGLLRLEWYSGEKLEWSGSLSVSVDANGRTDNVGTGVKWQRIRPGQRQHNVLTWELRGKSVWENVQGFVKRSFDGAKLQDFIPWAKK